MQRAPAASSDILKAATGKPSKPKKLSKPKPKKLTIKYDEQLSFSQPSSHVENASEPTLDRPVFGSQDHVKQMFEFRFEFPRPPSEFQPTEGVELGGGLDGKQDLQGVAETDTTLAYFVIGTYTHVPKYYLSAS